MPERFHCGRVVATPTALTAMNEAEASPMSLLARHLAGDWDEVCEQDRQANEEALVSGTRLMSVYTVRSGVVVWIITGGADDVGVRHCTTILLPADY